MAEGPNGWFVEEGIGEHRAVLIEQGEIIAAQIDWPGPLAAGLVADAVLIARAVGSNRGTARFASGEEALVDGLPKDASEGASLRLAVTRGAMAERGRLKRAQARPSTASPRPAPTLAERLQAKVVRQFDDWDELFVEAWSGEVSFAGGSLTLSPTPAMVLIDVDGNLPPRALALAAAPVIARAVFRFDLGGSIGIDFPTVKGKAERQAIAEAVDSTLPKPFERTAVNGFGFLQIVRSRRHASLVELAQDRPGFEVRALLRRASFEPAGAKRLVAHPAVIGVVQSNAHWLDELARQLGGVVNLRVDPSLPMSGGYAEPA